jgi:hypothetical protein
VAGFDELVTEALTAPFSGWDFSWLDRRSWTELLPLGIPVIQTEAAAENMDQDGANDGGACRSATARWT